MPHATPRRSALTHLLTLLAYSLMCSRAHLEQPAALDRPNPNPNPNPDPNPNPNPNLEPPAALGRRPRGGGVRRGEARLAAAARVVAEEQLGELDLVRVRG